VDLKVHDTRLVAAVSQLLTRYAATHTTLWGSFNHQTHTALYTANPGIPLFASGLRALFLLAAFKAGQLDKVHIYESAVIVPWRVSLLRGWLHLYPCLDRGWCTALNARGVSVVMYGGCNDEAAFEACTAAGASAICTDHPSRLQAWLAKRAKA
jgi:glycerophosphoryl diester phosphodiesterase